VRQTIREALAFDTLDGKVCTFPVIEAERCASIEAEIVFREIAMKVLFAAVLINALHAAFEN
jgi:hypothetical protein